MDSLRASPELAEIAVSFGHTVSLRLVNIAELDRIRAPLSSPSDVVCWHAVCIAGRLESDQQMQVWMANARGAVAQDHRLFRIIFRTLQKRRGRRRVELFNNLKTLAQLPWLNQPQLIHPTHLTLELYAAWDELWTLELSELAIRPRRTDCAREPWRTPTTFGSYFAGPMHQLAAFAASTTLQPRFRAATHLGLALGSTPISGLRVIRGGRPAPPDED